MPIALRNAPPREDCWGQALNVRSRTDVLRQTFGLTLIPWQEELFESIGGPDRPKVYYVSIARKSGKSYALAAFILTELILEPDSEIYIFSDSERNSKAVLFHELVTIVSMCPDSTLFKVHYDKIVYQPTGGFVMARPSNVAAVQGINPTLCCIDELHLQKNDYVYNGAIMAGAARVAPMLLCTTTPGYDTESLCHAVDLQVRAGELDGQIYGPPDPSTCYTDRLQWEISNPGLGFTFDMDSLESDFKLMPEHEFKRFRLGCWTETAQAWLPYGAWASRSVARTLKPGERIWAGFDGSYSGDSTALCVSTADGFVSVLGCWENPGKTEWRVPRDAVLAAVHDMFRQYDVVQLRADPPLWAAELAEWDRQYPGKVVEFPTFSRARMAPCCATFYAGVVDGGLTHPDDERLARHVAHSVVMSCPQGDYITKGSKNSPAKIDLAVAAVLAYSAAMEADRRPKPKRWVL